jgi:hypothetical protein
MRWTIDISVLTMMENEAQVSKLKGMKIPPMSVLQ